MKLRSVAGQRTICLGTDSLGRGGEATVYPVLGDTRMVAKIYHKPTADAARKLKLMISNPPMTALAGSGGSVAWPTDILLDEKSDFVGFLMPAVRACHPLSVIYFPPDRQRVMPRGFGYVHLLRLAFNLCIAVESAHKAGYVIGDLNDDNVLVSTDAQVTLIDCDSFQTSHHVTRMMRPEYAAPEYYSADWSTYRRTRQEDYFALAIMIHLLLMDGVHPYAGSGQPSQLDERILAGLSFHASNGAMGPRAALPVDFLTPGLQHLFRQAFVKGHRDPALRPGAGEWVEEIERAEQAVRRCRWGRPTHWYFNHSPNCPVCVLRKPSIWPIKQVKKPAPATMQRPMRLPLMLQNAGAWGSYLGSLIALGAALYGIGAVMDGSGPAPSGQASLVRSSNPLGTEIQWRQAKAPAEKWQHLNYPWAVKTERPAEPIVSQTQKAKKEKLNFSSRIATETGSDIYQEFLGDGP